MPSRIQYFTPDSTGVSPRTSGESDQVFLTSTSRKHNNRAGKPRRTFGRPSPERETCWSVVKKAIPHGWSVPSEITRVVEAFDLHPEVASLRSDTREILRRCLKAMVLAGAPGSKTTRITKAALAKRLGIHERSVSRHWRKLESLNLIALVAPGRSNSKDWAPSLSRAKKAQPINLAAVYVFCVPGEALQRRWDEDSRAAKGVHIKSELVTPTTLQGGFKKLNTFNPRTGARKSNEQVGSQVDSACSDDMSIWGKHHIPMNRREMLRAAATLRGLSPAFFHRMSDKDIRSLTREFFIAGWSAADIERALSTRPDGTPWPHDTPSDSQALQRIRPWVKYRLSAWKDEQGAPQASYWAMKFERQRVSRVKRRAARAAEVLQNAVRWAKLEIGRGFGDYKDGDGYRTARKALDQMFASNRDAAWENSRSLRIPTVGNHTV